MNYKYLVKEVSNCSKNEVEAFFTLVIKGGKVTEEGLLNRIMNCKFLGFCYNHSDEIIAISSLKRPHESYILKVIKSANLDRLPSELNFELGYSFTESEYRRKGINGELKRKILNEIQFEDCLIFSTTAIPSSQTFLLENGFVNYGKSYDGKNDKNIKYYEKKCGKI